MIVARLRFQHRPPPFDGDAAGVLGLHLRRKHFDHEAALDPEFDDMKYAGTASQNRLMKVVQRFAAGAKEPVRSIAKLNFSKY